MKKIFFKLKSKQKQSGIALIFALAMLSLLLIMAVGFATSAIFEQKAASNSANTTNAKVMAQSALNRVLALLNVYGDSIQYSHGATSTKDMLSRLTTTVSGTPLYTWQTADPVEWEYLKVDDGISNRLVGRFAYKVVPIAGIDPGAIVSTTVNEALGTEPRPGNNVTEINVMSVSSDISSALAQKFNYTTYASAPGQYPGNPPGWQSYDTFFKKLGITTSDLKGKFLKWFILDPPKSKEVFQVNTTPVSTYHRFNLNRAWAADFPAAYPPAAMYEKILLDKTPVDGVPDQLPTAYTVSGTSDGYGIPWLAFFGYTTDGTLDTTLGATFGNTAAGVIARRRQIAANLVNYCSSSAVPVSDVNPANWGTSDPTFTGNEKTPYLNELGLQVQVKAVRGSGTKPPITVTVSVYAVPELIDIYGLTPAAATVTVYYTISYNFTGTSGITIPAGVNTSGSYAIALTAANWGSVKRYGTPTTWSPIYNNTPINGTKAANKNTNVTVKVNSLVVSVNKVILTYGGTNVDCAKINATTTAWPTSVSFSLPASTTPTLTCDNFLSFQANDPRQNLNAGDWTKTESAPVNGTAFQSTSNYNSGTTQGTITSGGTGASSINKLNGAVINPAGGPDAEGIDPAYDASTSKPGISTACVDQGVMLSPWELGAIHRGAAWETINLKAYDQAKANTFIATDIPDASYHYARIPGGGAYADGDANILDHVKMDAQTDNYKVNINVATDPVTGQNVVLQALLKNIPVGSSYVSPGTGGTLITDATVLSSLVTAITTRTGNYQTRAAVAGVAKLYDGTCGTPQGTDALKEELIGKFINLTDVSGKSQYFYVILLAQAIKDIGGPSSGTSATDIIISKKKSDDTVISIPTRLGQFDCDAANNIYADEIVGEQKIKALIFMEPVTNKCKILSYEFMACFKKCYR